MEYFKALQACLNIEREEDLRQYQTLTNRTSINVRRTHGLSWYPVAIRATELGRGDYLNVELERTTHHDIVHQFRFGAPLALFSNHNPEERIEGTITNVSGNRCKVSFRVEELPEWSRNGKLGMDLLFDNNSYNEMDRALKAADDAVNGPKATLENLPAVLTGLRKPTINNKINADLIPGLNDGQQKAVEQILAAEDLAIVHGPPGTGKTTTLVAAIKALIKREKQQILVVAPSNTAVDLLTEKLAEAGVRVLRIGNPARVDQKLMNLTLDGQMAAHEGRKNIKTLRKQAAALKDMAHKYKRNFGRAEQEQRKALFNEAHKIMKEVEGHETYLSDQIINNAEVITATLVGANHYTIRQLDFKTVVIDEAGQALEPACWIPILKSKKLIMAGDHCQLPPTIKSQEAAKKGLALTLMEKLTALYPESVVMLEEQYRMHEQIMNFSAQEFYGGRLSAHFSVAKATLMDNDHPFTFIDTAGCGFDEQQEESSISNPDEGLFVLNCLKQYLEMLNPSESGNPSVGLISPYQEQVKFLATAIASDPVLNNDAIDLTVNTIDSFQGQERDLVVISLTRSNAARNIGFLSDIRRLNVAITRAKKKLIIIGDSSTLSAHPFYINLIGYAERHGSYESAWTYLLD